MTGVRNPYRRHAALLSRRKDIAMQSAEFLKRNNPSRVEIKDLHTGVVIAVAHKGP
jgi:hypothetical protein